MTNEEILAKRAQVVAANEISPQLHKWARNFHIDGINKNKNKNSTFTHYVGLRHHEDKLKSQEGSPYKSSGTHPELRKDLANMHKRTAKNIGPSHPDFENHVKLANYHHENAKTKNETASEISGVEMASTAKRAKVLANDEKFHKGMATYHRNIAKNKSASENAPYHSMVAMHHASMGKLPIHNSVHHAILKHHEEMYKAAPNESQKTAHYHACNYHEDAPLRKIMLNK